ncbi:MAG: flagellar M-ring protein FliF [Candidatus Zixiibacteriota bacterium]|nr:MAG: flagellar M-ring protein FliF [candidate division Zixibacteria bacterium]
MDNLFTALPKQIKELFDRLTLSQKASLAGLTLLTGLAIVGLLTWANRPQYTVLFSELSGGDASKIRDKLHDGKVRYKLESGGSTILVPSDRVYDLRLELAADGIPSQHGVGYEIFDRTNLGMSDFVQKLNYRRALEGELARTIISIAEVEQARVHLVIPEPSLFKDDEKDPTASVVLKFKGRSRLSEDQVRGIATLVARSVEGLDPDNVTILDAFGNLLSGMKSSDPGIGLTSTQLELQHKVEAYLASKAQTMLDGVLSPGRSIVRVTAELDFQQIERTSEVYDPESQVVRSEERMKSQASDLDAAPSKEENSLTNYEINKTVEHLVSTGGNIKRLSAAVIVDGHYRAGADGAMEYTPRDAREMGALSNMVRGALGLREERGDVLEISNLAFDKESFQEQQEVWAAEDQKDMIINLLPKAVLVLALLMLAWMVRGILRQSLKATRQVLEPQPALVTSGAVPPQLMAGYNAARAPVSLPPIEAELSESARELAQRKEQIAQFAKAKPEAATQLLKTWLLER